MWLTTTFQRHLCILFLTTVFIATILTRQKKPQSNYSFQEFKRSSRGTIHILGLFELTTPRGPRIEGVSEVAAAELAIQHVNQLNVLPDYTLDLLVNDTKCDPGVGIDAFFHAIYSNRTVVMLLGSGCSNVTESLAHIVPYWNVLQISFGSSSPSLSDRTKFPFFFRTIAPDSSHNAAKIAFIRRFGWKVVAAFGQSGNEFLLPLNSLISGLESHNVTCVATVTFSLDNYKEQLRVLKESDVRIIIGSLSSRLAERIFCEVHHLQMYGADYVWILQDRGETWWNVGRACGTQEMGAAVEGLILVADYNVLTENNTSISGLDDELFESELSIPKSEISPYARLVYDAVWAMALTLMQIHPFDTFTYNRSDMVCKFVERMSSLNFMGISGPVKFIGGDRIGSSVIRQIQSGRIRDVAVYDSNRNWLDFECRNCTPIKWHEGRIPIAHRKLKVTLISIPKALLYCVIAVCVLGIAFALFFLYFNLRFRRMKTVKLSSPKLNNVAVVGCILVYLSVIILGFDTTTTTTFYNQLCIIHLYLLSSGFSLAFGSMFAKTYRVHRIFFYGNIGKVKDKLLKDKHLIVLILIPLAIDAIILTLWVAIDPLERQLYNLTLQTNSDDRGVVYQPQVEVCRSHNTSGWLLAIFGYKGLLLIMGVFMAWETRHVKISALNDSQYIGICVYGAVFSAIITFLSSFINEYIVISYLAKTISILTSTTITLFLLFLPKLKAVFNNHLCPDPIMQSMGLKMESNTRRFIKSDPKEQMLRLEIQNNVYKCQLETLDSEIARLEKLLEQDEGDIFTVSPKEDYKLSWVSCPDDFSKSGHQFPVFGKVKRILESLRRASTPQEMFLNVEDLGFKHKSNPEVHTYETRENLAKAASEFNILKK